jgi:hypothetical protein
LADTVPIWVPVATAFGGFFANGVLEWLKDERANSRESETRRAKRAEAREDRRDDSQIESIKALQKAIYDFALAVRDYNYESRQEGGVSDAALTQVEAVMADVAFYKVRIFDDEARSLVQAFIDAAKSSRKALTTETEMKMIGDAHTKAHDRLGELYRQLLQSP